MHNLKNICYLLLLISFTYSCDKESESNFELLTENHEFYYAKNVEDFENYSVPEFLSKSILEYNGYSLALSEPTFQEEFGEIILNVDFSYESSRGDTVKFYIVEKNEQISHLLIAGWNNEKSGVFLISKTDTLYGEDLSDTPLEPHLQDFFNGIYIVDDGGGIQATPIDILPPLGCYDYIPCAACPSGYGYIEIDWGGYPGGGNWPTDGYDISPPSISSKIKKKKQRFIKSTLEAWINEKGLGISVEDLQNIIEDENDCVELLTLGNGEPVESLGVDEECIIDNLIEGNMCRSTIKIEQLAGYDYSRVYGLSIDFRHNSLGAVVPVTFTDICFQSQSLATNQIKHFLELAVSLVELELRFAYPNSVPSPQTIAALFQTSLTAALVAANEGINVTYGWNSCQGIQGERGIWGEGNC